MLLSMCTVDIEPKVVSLTEGRDVHEYAQIIKDIPGVAIQLII